MAKSRLSVVVPSRTQPLQESFLRKCVASVRAQLIEAGLEIAVIVGVDARAAEAVEPLGRELKVTLTESNGASQAAALNAALQTVESDFVALLEDDDTWDPLFLQTAYRAIEIGAAFVSSTQLEVDENNVTIGINDFPTPSGWLMTRSTLAAVGLFNDSYRFHLDNEWLGRLAQTAAPRIHLVECTAPVDPRHVARVRPYLNNVTRLSGGHCRLGRHASPFPLVRRLLHSRSGIARIAADPSLAEISGREVERLRAHFGHVPW